MGQRPSVQTFSATVVRDGPSCYVLPPFDPKASSARAPVVVTIAAAIVPRRRAMAPDLRGLRESHRKAAGLEGGETVKAGRLDTAPRTVAAPADLLRALKAVRAPRRVKASSYTTRARRSDEGAKKPETRAPRRGRGGG
jgi:hypothetical protein